MDIDVVRTVCRIQPLKPYKVNIGMFRSVCKSGDIAIAKEIVKLVDLNVGCIKSLPLHVAIAMNVEMVDVVLEAGADINFKAEQGGSLPALRHKYPIEVAIDKGDAMMKHLIKRGAQLPHISRWLPLGRRRYDSLREVSRKRGDAGDIPTWDKIRKMRKEEILAL
jgi:hypothetical protein